MGTTLGRSINYDPDVGNHFSLADLVSIIFPEGLVMKEQWAYDKDIREYKILQYGPTGTLRAPRSFEPVASFLVLPI